MNTNSGSMPRSNDQNQAEEQDEWEHVNSAFIGTDLENQLRQQAITTLVNTGPDSPLCANCYKMPHRRRTAVTAIDELRGLIEEAVS